MSRRRSFWPLIAVLVVALGLPAVWFLAGPAGAGARAWLGVLFAGPATERMSGYYTLIDEKGRVLLRTALGIARGDLFIDGLNRRHRVTRITGTIAQTALEAPGATGAGVPTGAGPGEPVLPAWASTGSGWKSTIPLGSARQVIVIYHTHSDESYIPTDATDSIDGHGGIYDVGNSLASALTAHGFTVVHDLAAHDPHDAGAYPRSRVTVLQNLKYGPTFLFDLHRDSAPPEDYITWINGVETSKVLIVIGGRNPMFQSNLGIADQLKAVSDAMYPDLVKGILVAGGNYNQDLDPGNILLEFGADTIPKPDAERAATLWADVVSAYLGPPGPQRPTTSRYRH